MSPTALLISSIVLFLAVGLAFGCVEHFRPARRLRTDGRWLLTSLLGVVLLLLFANLSDLLVHAPIRDWVIANVTGPIRIRLPHLLTMLIALVLNDFVGYWIHRGLHAFGWPIHRWHHSAKSLNWLSGTFGSFPHFVLTLGPPIVPAVLFDFSGPEFLFGYVSFVFIQHWNHANFAVARGSWFEWFFITPQAHRIHHAATPELHDANFGFVFTAWDRMFGTYVDPNTVLENFEVGLGETEKPGLLRMIIGY